MCFCVSVCVCLCVFDGGRCSEMLPQDKCPSDHTDNSGRPPQRESGSPDADGR